MPFRFNRLHGIYAASLLFAVVLVGCGDESEAPVVEAGQQSVRVEDPASVESRRRILFFGDSITAGYGLDPEDAFPALIQDEIDELGWPYQAVNAGLTGETSAGGVSRIDWLLKKPVDVLVIELGGNDGLRGLPAGATRINLKTIIEKVRAEYPDAAVVIAGMRMPPNLGKRYAEDFASVYPDLAEELDATLIPFIGKGVVGRWRLVQMDGIHPTAKGHEVVAETVWEYLEPVIREQLEKSK